MKALDASKLNFTATLLEGNLSTLYLTAPHSGCGTSTVALSLAQVMLDLITDRVLLIDGNLGSPDLTRHFQLEGKAGLTDVCVGQDDLSIDECLHAVGEKHLYVMPKGSIPTRTLKDLEKARFVSLLGKIRDRFGYVIFDAAPVHARHQTLAMATCFDGTVLVLEAGDTRQEVAMASLELLQQAGGRLAGTILNRRKYFIPQHIYNWL